MDWFEAEGALLDLLVEVASGRRTASEAHFPRDGEFAPWQPDPVL
jgi:altronate dehydratase